MEHLAASELANPRIDARALLSLHDPADGIDWGSIRAAQVQAGAGMALFLVAANVVGAALVAMILGDATPLWPLVGWAAAVAGGAALVAFRRLAARQRIGRSADCQDLRGTVIDGVLLGLLWTMPTFALGHGATLNDVLGMWIVLSVLMTAAALGMAVLPLANLVFLGIVGVATAVMIHLAAGVLLAIAALSFTLLLMAACFDRARALVIVRAAEAALAERDETVSLLLHEFEERAADWLWETDGARNIVRASPRFASAAGHDPASMNGKPLLQVLAGVLWETGKFPPSLHQLSDRLNGREPFRALVLPVTVQGRQRWWEIAASPRFDDQGRFLGFRGVGSDVTEQRESTAKIHKMARYDTLTGLPNRLLINETLAEAIADADKFGGRCAFLLIDLDRFKAVNDTLGHPVGDRLLVRVAERLAQIMTDNEMVGRLGGDEFAVVMRDAMQTERIDQLALSIVDTLSKPYEVDQNTLHIGCSVGIAVGMRDGRTPETLIRSADLALYRSKDAGGGAFHYYDPNLHVVAEERRVLELALRKALELREFHVQYQPVVSSESGGLAGFEALLRWRNDEFGDVSPAKFIPLAEDARLIGPIGEWVLRTACAEAAGWPSPLRVAVNVSAEQLMNPSFVTVVAQALAQSGLPAERLELEVTESVFMREGTVAILVLERILDLGVRLSLDDFGTGYSSLGYLSRTRFSTIKIDRSFVVQAARGGREALAIIRAVVAMARSLSMATTAEGVESEQELLLVQDLGCTKVQGYLFGRPMPVEEARFLASNADMGAAAA